MGPSQSLTFWPFLQTKAVSPPKRKKNLLANASVSPEQPASSLLQGSDDEGGTGTLSGTNMQSKHAKMGKNRFSMKKSKAFFLRLCSSLRTIA